MGAPTTERSKVATVISLLTGCALEWATTVWDRREELGSYERFMAHGSASSTILQREERGVGAYSNYGSMEIPW
jgi:hypothetical protein